MNKLVVAFPLFYHVAVPFFTRWNHMNKRPMVASIDVNGAYITTACETIVAEALALMGKQVKCPVQGGPRRHIIEPRTQQEEPQPPDEPIEWDRLVIIEHDVLPPVDALVRVAHYAPEHDIVGSMVFSHHDPYSAMVFIEHPQGELDMITSQTVKAWCDDPMLYRCDATSFSFISIARHVLEDWDPATPMFGMDERVGSHDLWFCKKAREQGFSVWVDSGIVCDHLTTVPIGITHNQSALLADDVNVREFSFAED